MQNTALKPGGGVGVPLMAIPLIREAVDTARSLTIITRRICPNAKAIDVKSQSRPVLAGFHHQHGKGPPTTVAAVVCGGLVFHSLLFRLSLDSWRVVAPSPILSSYSYAQVRGAKWSCPCCYHLRVVCAAALPRAAAVHRLGAPFQHSVKTFQCLLKTYVTRNQSQLSAPPVWYSITRVSKKFFSFFRSMISLIHGKGLLAPGYSSFRPIWVRRRLAMNLR